MGAAIKSLFYISSKPTLECILLKKNLNDLKCHHIPPLSFKFSLITSWNTVIIVQNVKSKPQT